MKRWGVVSRDSCSDLSDSGALREQPQASLTPREKLGFIITPQSHGDFGQVSPTPMLWAYEVARAAPRRSRPLGLWAVSLPQQLAGGGCFPSEQTRPSVPIRSPSRGCPRMVLPGSPASDGL